MKVILEIDDNVLKAAQERANDRGVTIEQLVNKFLAEFGANAHLEAAADEFRRLSREAKGNSRGWKFNREEIQRKIR